MILSKLARPVIETSIRLITYGLGNSLDISKISDAKNSAGRGIGCKPIPGSALWGSPVDSGFGWREWCTAESFGSLETSFQFTVMGKVFRVDSVADMNLMPWVTYKDVYWRDYIDFETMKADGIDAVWLTEKGQWETRHSTPHDMYGWDCESVCVLNKDCVTP